MGFTKGVYRDRTFLPPLARPKAGEARHIDGCTQRFEILADGGYRTMQSTMQRVLLILSFETPRPSSFSTDNQRETWRRQALKALRVLTASQPPVITDLIVKVTSSRPGEDEVSVSFIDATTGDQESTTL